jgi:hypothetical protein
MGKEATSQRCDSLHIPQLTPLLDDEVGAMLYLMRQCYIAGALRYRAGH